MVDNTGDDDDERAAEKYENRKPGVFAEEGGDDGGRLLVFMDGRAFAAAAAVRMCVTCMRSVCMCNAHTRHTTTTIYSGGARYNDRQ